MPIHRLAVRTWERQYIEENKSVSLRKHLMKHSFLSKNFLVFQFCYFTLLFINSHHTNFISTSGIRACFLLFDLANTNFQLQCPHLKSDNYEIYCIHVKVQLGSQDMWEMIEKGIKEPIKGVTLTSLQRKVVQQVLKKYQQTLTIIHEYLDDATFEIVTNATTTKHAWKVLQQSNQGAGNVRKVRL